MLACVLQRSLAGSTFNIPTSFCSFSGFLLDVVTRSVETQEWKRLLPKLDATQTAWRRWVTYQYSFSEGGRFKTICAMLSLKLNSVPYQFLVVSNKSTVLKTIPWILFLLQWLILKEIIAIFNKLKRTNYLIDCPISNNSSRFRFGHVFPFQFKIVAYLHSLVPFSNDLCIEAFDGSQRIWLIYRLVK